MSNRQQAGNERRSANAARVWGTRKSEIEWLYSVQQWSQQKIAEYFSVSLAGVQKAMRRLGFKPRTKANYGSRNGRYKDGSQSRLYRLVIVKDKCRHCGTKDNLSVHHKNDDHYDNRLENLEVVCNSCHMSETKRRWWAAKKKGLPTPKSNGPVGWKKRE